MTTSNVSPKLAYDMRHILILLRVLRTQINCKQPRPWNSGESFRLLNETFLVVFRTYDLKGNGFITREELFLLLRNTLTKFPSDEDTEEALRELVEISMKLMVILS